MDQPYATIELFCSKHKSIERFRVQITQSRLASGIQPKYVKTMVGGQQLRAIIIGYHVQKKDILEFLHGVYGVDANITLEGFEGLLRTSF